MLTLVDDRLVLVFAAPLAGALLLFGLARGPLWWPRVVAGLAASLTGLVTAVVSSLYILDRGGFALADVRGWVGVRVEGADPFGLVPSALSPGQAPLLVAVEVAGLLATWLLVPHARRLKTTGPLAAALAATGGAALLVVARHVDGLGAAFSLVSLAGFGLLVSFHPKRVDVEGAVRVFLLHRAGDALLLTALLVVGTAVGEGDLEKLATAAPAIDPWLRATAGPFAGFAARDAWSLVAALVAAAVATRLAFGPLLPLVRDASGAPGAAVGLAHGMCFIGAALITLYRLSPVLWLAPEVMMTLGIVGAAGAFIAGLFAVSARDVVRIDVNLLYGFGALATVLYAAGDLGTGTLATALFLAAAVPLCTTSGVILERTGRADPFALGGLEHLMPRTHTARLLATGALFGPVFTGACVVAHITASALFAPWLGSGVAAGVLASSTILALAAFRALHLVFTGKEPRDKLSAPVVDANAAWTLPPLIVALPLLGLGLLHIPDGILAALPLQTTYLSPAGALVGPERAALQGLRAHLLPQLVPPGVGPVTVSAVAIGALFLGWLASTLLYRGGPGRLHRALFGGPRMQKVVARAAQLAGSESQVVKGVGEGAARLSRLIATNLAPGVLDTLLRRLPALLGVVLGALVRFVADGSAQRGLAIALLVLAGMLTWWGKP